MTPALSWPPDGWQAPLTPEEFDGLVTVPEPIDADSCIDPLGLAE